MKEPCPAEVFWLNMSTSFRNSPYAFSRSGNFPNNIRARIFCWSFHFDLCLRMICRLRARWYNEVSAFGNNEFDKVLETFENHNTTIINYFERRLTNASAESFNAKIKAFRTQFRGVGDIKFFMFRLATLYS